MAIAFGNRNKSPNKDAIIWIELYGGPGDGFKQIRHEQPESFSFPDDFIVAPDSGQAVYERYKPALTVIDPPGRPMRVVTAMLYVLKGAHKPTYRLTQYRRLRA